jgi:probable rRNA maturation factor
VILNRQTEVRVDVQNASRFAKRLRRELRLRDQMFNVCFVSDHEITQLNKTYRGNGRPTDVLSFCWKESSGEAVPAPGRDFERFLGDIVISAQTAQRSARAEGHSSRVEIRWLILHGVLHLLGYDHETDCGEMAELELALRDRLDERREGRRAGGRPKTLSGSVRGRVKGSSMTRPKSLCPQH